MDAQKPLEANSATPTDRTGTLASSAWSGLMWNYVGVAARFLSSFVIGIVLARLLDPKSFGQVAIAWIIIGLGNLVADFGFGAALVQRQEISQESIRFVFTVQVAIGAAMTALAMAMAPLVASLFGQPEVTPVLRTVAWIFLLQAFGQTAASLLRRRLDFRALQTSQVFSYLVGYGLCGITLAYAGFGVWSLVAAQLTQTLIYSVSLYLRVRHPIAMRTKLPARGLLGFGTKAIGTNVVNWALTSLDPAVVGRLFGAMSLGLYNRALTLMTTPTTAAVSSLQAVLFPAASRVQNRASTLKRVYLAVLGVISSVVAPIFVAVAVCAPTVIEGLYGSRWVAAAPLLVPLALGMPAYSAVCITGPVLWAMGRVELELRAQIITLAAAAVAYVAASHYSLVLLAWAFGMVCVLRFLLMTFAIRRALDLQWCDIGGALRGAILMLPLVVGCVWACDRVIGTAAPASVRLAFDALAGGSMLAAVLVKLPKLLGKEAQQLLLLHSARFPAFISRVLVTSRSEPGAAVAS